MKILSQFANEIGETVGSTEDNVKSYGFGKEAREHQSMGGGLSRILQGGHELALLRPCFNK